MKFFLKTLIITILLSSGLGWSFKSCKNLFASSEFSEEISSQTKEKPDSKEIFGYLMHNSEPAFSKAANIALVRSEEKTNNFFQEVPTSPPNS